MTRETQATNQKLKCPIDGIPGMIHTLHVPTISRFRNMKIQMFFLDHNPPHFHVRHARENCICLLNGDLHEGTLTNNKLAEIQEWAALHPAELAEDWNLCSEGKTPNLIPGLD